MRVITKDLQVKKVL